MEGLTLLEGKDPPTPLLDSCKAFGEIRRDLLLLVLAFFSFFKSS